MGKRIRLCRNVCPADPVKHRSSRRIRFLGTGLGFLLFSAMSRELNQRPYVYSNLLLPSRGSVLNCAGAQQVCPCLKGPTAGAPRGPHETVFVDDH